MTHLSVNIDQIVEKLYLLAEYSYYKPPMDSPDFHRVYFQRILKDGSSYVDLEKFRKLTGIKELTYLDSQWQAEDVVAKLKAFAYALSCQSIDSCNGIPNDSSFYEYGTSYDRYYHEIKVSRIFASDFAALPRDVQIRAWHLHICPIFAGLISSRGMVENMRKYNDDSFEFYTPIEDGELIITWRYYADLYGALSLKYFLSVESIRPKPLEIEYSVFESCGMMSEQLRAAIKEPDHNIDYIRTDSLCKLRRMTPNTLQKLLRKTREDFHKDREDYLLDDKAKYKPFVYLKPRFSEVSCENLVDLEYIRVKTLCPTTVIDGIKKITEEIAEIDRSAVKNRDAITKSKELQAELKKLTDIRDSSYQVYCLNNVDYTELIGDLPKALQLYYEKVDSELLQKSLKRTGLVESKFTDLQKQIAFNSQNELFFGRSGTGKTHCCVHAMVSRHLTVDAINKKLHLKTTDSKPAVQVQGGLKSIFITASPLLAKEVKVQYETTLKRAELLNAKEDIPVLTEDLIFDNLNAVQMRSRELPKTFFDEDISYPLFLSHQEFVTILYNTMVDRSTDFKHTTSAVKMEVTDDDKIIEKRISDIIKTFGQEDDKMKNALKFMPKRGGKSITETKARRQIDFRTFYNEFYKKKIARNAKLAKISSNVAWSEIRTKIKGSSFSYFEETCGVGYNSNNSTVSKKVMDRYFELQQDAKISKLVWEIFESYESWKQYNNYYDIEDFVGLFYRKIKKWPFKDFNFDLIVIDEVQDLSFNSISVLTNMCLNNFMICGDNAQNIEKGINFKFKELRGFLTKTISNRSTRIVDYGNFYNQEVSLPELSHYHLGLNFRSSAEILDLANLVVCLLETYFGNEIDSFPKEKGFFKSPKPVVVELGQDIAFLVDLLETYLKMEVAIETSETMDDSVDQSGAAIAKKSVKIGNDFCVIVRDEAAKKFVPEELQNCIILTLQESKGLEFENVLLFNHFTGNDAEKGWRYIYTRTEVQERELKGTEKSDLDTETDLFRRSKLELQKLVKEDSQRLFEFSTNSALDQISVQVQLEGLSADMKFLYVAITRAKKNLIIYDYSVPKSPNHVRNDFDKMCIKLDLIVFANKDNLASFADKYDADINWKAGQQAIARDKGFCFLKQGEYASAERFFKVSNDTRLLLYCKASEKAKAAGDLLSLDFDDDLKKKYASIGDLHAECYAIFRESAEMFKSLGKHNEAAKCYFNAEDYEEASRCFRFTENKLHLAHSLFMLQNYEVALPIYYELEQDDMVQACMYNLSEGGKDMKKFASLLSGMSDEAKKLAKCDDTTFTGYIVSVFEELQHEMIREEDLFGEPAMEEYFPEQANNGKRETEISEKRESEMMEEGEDESFAVISDRKSIDEFVEIGSVLSDLRSSGGSFEKLPSLRGDKPGQSPTAVADTIMSKLEGFFDRIKHILNKQPGHESLFINTKESNIENMVYDLAVVYKFEDLGLELLKSSKTIDTDIHHRLIVNKLLNIDLNVCSAKVVDPFTPRAKKETTTDKKECMDDLLTLNIFDTVSAFKLLPDGEFNKVDDIIKHLFFHICIMGLAEYFYQMAIDSEVRDQLSYFVSKTKLQALQTTNIEGFKVVAVNENKRNRARASDSAILNEITGFMQTKKVFVQSAALDVSTLEATAECVVELFTRVVETRDNEEARENLTAAVTACDVWEIIKLLRVTFKKRYLVKNSNKDAIRSTLTRMFDAKDCSSATLVNGCLDEFMIIPADNWILELAKSNPELSSSIRAEKGFNIYSLTRDEELYMVNSEQFGNFAFSVCVYELLSLYKIKNQNDLIKLEVKSQLTSNEKKAIKFSKIYTKKADEILLTFDFEGCEPAALDDYVYRKVLTILGNQKLANFFSVYQYFSLMERSPTGNKLIPQLIIDECQKAEKKKNRTFFLLKEIDELTKGGQIGQAYYKLKDLNEYNEEKSVSSTKANEIWLIMKEMFLLIIAYAMVPPKDEATAKYFSFPGYVLLPSYFKEQLRFFDWILEKDGVMYIDESKVSLESVDDISYNIKDKLHALLEEEPKSLYQVTPDLKDYINGLFVDSANFQAHSDFIKLVRIGEPVDSDLSEALAKRAEQKNLTDMQVEESKELASVVRLKLATIKKLKISSTDFIKRKELSATFNGKIFTPYQVRSPCDELCKISQLRSQIIGFVLEKKLIAPQEYHYLVNLLCQLSAGLKVDPQEPWHLKLSQSAVPVQKKFDCYLAYKKSQSALTKKDEEHYQKEIEKKLKMISMIGGQIYKRITDRSSAKMKLSK